MDVNFQIFIIVTWPCRKIYLFVGNIHTNKFSSLCCTSSFPVSVELLQNRSGMAYGTIELSEKGGSLCRDREIVQDILLSVKNARLRTKYTV